MLRKVEKNYIFSMLYQLFTVITPVITTPYIARVLQSDGVGLYSYTYTMAAVFVNLAQMGAASYGSRQVAYNAHDPVERTRIFWNISLLKALNAAVACVIYVCIYRSHEYWELFRIQMLCIIAMALDVTWFFSGMEEISLMAIRNVLTKIISIACVFLFVKDRDDVGLYSFILAAAIIAGRVSSWAYLPRFLVRIPLKSIKIFEDFGTILTLFIPVIAGQLYTYVDKSLLGMMSDAHESGYYAQAERLIGLCSALITPVVSVMFPRVAGLFYQKRKEEATEKIYLTYRATWMLGLPAMCGLFILVKQMIPWFLGPGYDQVASLCRMLSFQMVFACINSVTVTLILVATGRQKFSNITVLIGLATNACLDILLIPGWKANGAVVATITAELLMMVLHFYFTRKDIQIKKVLKSAIPYAGNAFVMACVLLVVVPYFPQTILGTALLIGIGVLIYGIGLIVTRDKLVMTVLERYIPKR